MCAFYACHLNWTIDRAKEAGNDYRHFLSKKLHKFFKMFSMQAGMLNI